MTDIIPTTRLLRVMSVGGIAEMILNPSTLAIDRYHAIRLFRKRLQEFNGAMWIGAPLYERKATINVLKMIEGFA